MISIKSFVFNPFSENTYVLFDETKDCIIIDTGCYENNEKEELKNFIYENALNVVRLLNTHCHIDHVLGNSFVANTFDVNLEIHERELVILKAVTSYSSNYGFPNYDEQLPGKFLKENDQIRFGESNLEVLFTPGHAPGHVLFVNKEQKFCIGGDVLFQMSIGRTDLPGGDFDTLIDSIQQKIFPLGDDWVVYPGHGSTTTIGFEKENNPFCKILSS